MGGCGHGHPGCAAGLILSGFLITAILLGQPQGDAPLGRKLRAFFATRILQIGPICYAVLLAGWLIDLAGIRGSVGWHALHLFNSYSVLRGTKEPWVVAHLWTLSVEEQFYLVCRWPCC